MNKKLVIPLMVLLFMLETTVVPWLIPEPMYGRIAPHFVFVAALYAGLYAGRHQALLLGFFFGLVQDIVFYGHLLGVHSLLMGVIAYLTGLLLEGKRIPMLTALAVIGLACFLYDAAAYGVYRIFRVTHETFEFVLLHSIAPSLFLQIGFALAVYVPARRLFEAKAKKNADEAE
ncbi:rod shape-determining protein MreD [Thermobacillus composti KWC4]|uniref:Rod shape-determining protein MreD n=1 Tax=Thermobacillus composti (strain DSM 18247 / JCM 13945 / KWC4) TaxID=717605 RepID=L0EG35_THECK|nr:rod shape-determining protein MreD [Thermobacillus composti]AGA58646.1 rod shape-determining protein MreD [Thermobacillus composti KWC4]